MYSLSYLTVNGKSLLVYHMQIVISPAMFGGMKLNPEPVQDGGKPIIIIVAALYRPDPFLHGNNHSDHAK